MHKVRDHTFVLKFSGTGGCAIAQSYVRFYHFVWSLVCWSMGTYSSTRVWQMANGREEKITRR